ncbi:Rof/RNase P-like protein [Crucibulum laeve]|uniref:Ribonuclease P protein subunit n=1 Tax=Crucibulum laeve TaxID=68775 RepID=A0A5C3M6F1_9AGAR|nr:Rof/RNase P-like protein [Crucibulum laeve]
MYASRIHGRMMLLENPQRESRAKKEMELKHARRKAEKEQKKLGIIGKREAREKGVWKFDEQQMKFELFVPLHHMWMGYMSELLGLAQPPMSSSPPPSAQTMPGSSGLHPKLVKADFHGSVMTVRRSKNPSLIGLSGIVIHETENAFKIITTESKVKVLPKQNSIFAFAIPLYSIIPTNPAPNSNQKGHTPTPFPPIPPKNAQGTVLDLPHMEFELHGNQFCFRSADRVGRKFKHKETIEL